jgi:hypothetical protein
MFSSITGLFFFLSREKYFGSGDVLEKRERERETFLATAGNQILTTQPLAYSQYQLIYTCSSKFMFKRN